MLDSNDFYNAIKLAAMKAVEASQPCDFLFGKVTSVSPLKVAVEQKMTLGSAQLVLTRNVSDHTVPVTMNLGGEMETKTITIHNGLKTGDEVILLKKKGGQKYLILDKVVNA